MICVFYVLINNYVCCLIIVQVRFNFENVAVKAQIQSRKSHYKKVHKNVVLFRFIVIKYADRGMVQTGGLSSGLFNKLYIIFTASSSIYTYLSLLVRLWISDEERFHVIRSWLINEEYFHVVRPLYVKFKPNFYIFCLCTFIISIIFCNVQYIKKHKIGLKKKIQRNVMTFNVNFYFFILFMFLSLLQNLLKSLAVTEQSGFVESFI